MFFLKKLLVASASACLLASTATAVPLVFTSASQAQSRTLYNPPSNGVLRVSVPGATRSAGCSTDGANCLIGLVPDLILQAAPVPQTISERPTMYFLIPKVDGKADFRLYETDISPDNDLKAGKRIYRTSFRIKEKAGIIAFKLPDAAPKLELGKNYIWEFEVNELTTNSKVQSALRRVAPSSQLVAQLVNTIQPIERATLLAKEGIWFDTIQTLAEVKQGGCYNAEIDDTWISLLKSAKLDRVLPYSFIKTK